MPIRRFIQKTRLLLEEGLHESRRALGCVDSHPPRALDVVQLEQRILMSASPVAAVDATAVEQPAEAADSQHVSEPQLSDQQLLDVVADTVLPQQTAVSEPDASDAAFFSTSQKTLELVFIDSGVSNLDQMIADLQSEDVLDDSRTLEVVVLDAQKNGIAQITSTLLNYNRIDGIHIVSHGSDGAVRLGATALSLDNLDTYRSAISAWQFSLSEQADLLFYGCDLAATADGQELMNQIAAACDCDVAASEDLTGHQDLGGDWDLEYSVGTIDAQIAFSHDLQTSWLGILGSGTFQQGDVNGYSGTQDTELDSGSPDANKGGNTKLSTDLDDGSGVAQGLIRFDSIVGAGASQIPQGVQITSASLTVQVIGSSTGTISLHRMLQSWDESSTWNSLSGGLTANDTELAITPDSQIPGNSGSQTWTGLEATVQQWVDGYNNYGWGILNDSTDGWDIDSSEGAIAPLLSTTWIDPGSQASTVHTVTVDTTSDVWDGDTTSIDTLLANKGADGFISLREAIWAANNTANFDASTPDVINFAIGAVGSQQTIVLSEALPSLTDSVVLDAMTQGGGGYSGNPLIRIDGSSTANFATAGITVWTSDSTVRGFVVTGSTDEGIEVAGSSGHGAANNNIIENNWVGIDFSGIAAANADSGILVVNGASNNIVRNNVVAGNSGIGIDVRGASVDSNVVEGNIVGLAADGTTVVANGSYGIRVSDTATNTRIGTDGNGTNDAAERNIISGNTSNGIYVENADATVIDGNYIGTDVTGTLDRGNNLDGVTVGTGATNTVIGTAGFGNLISGNNDEGIDVDPGVGAGTLIRANYIGTNAAGTAAIPNGQAGPGTWGGILLDGNGITIGGTGAGERNVISGNYEFGIQINSSNNTVYGNLIGTQADGTSALGNSGNGIGIDAAATGNIIGGVLAGESNIIAHNSAAGIALSASASTGNRIRGNSIYDNTLIGIDLNDDGATANDTGVQDADTGPNNLQNYPILTKAAATAGTVTLAGTVDSSASTTLTLDFYSTSAAYTGTGEGQTWLGSTQLTTDAGGIGDFHITLNAVVPPGDYITATATDPSDNTSEFSAARTVTVAGPSLWLTTDADVSSPSGAPGLDAWSGGDVLDFGDPNLSFGAGTTNGTLSALVDFDSFLTGAKPDALHFVSRDITVGNTTTFNLLAGDLLFSVVSDGTLVSTNSLTVQDEDLIVFRPDTAGDYRSGSFYTLIDYTDINTGDRTGWTLVEADTTIGDATVTAGTFLYAKTGSADIYQFTPDEVGDTTSATVDAVLIEGAGIGADQEVSGLELIESNLTIGGTTLASGQILVSLNATDNPVGGISTVAQDIFILDITTTGVGATTGSATMFLQGANVSLNSAAENITGLTLVNRSSVLGLPGGSVSYTENNPATVIDAAATVSDVDSTDLNGGDLTVSISSGGTANDVLSIKPGGNVTLSGSNVLVSAVTVGTYSGGTSGTPLTIGWNGNSSPSAVQEVLRQIAFSNTSDAPSTTPRTVTFVLTDGDGGTSAPVSETVNVTAVNDSPIAVNDTGALTFDGIDDYVEIPDDTVGFSLTMTDTMTMETWIKPVSGAVNSSMVIINKEGEYELGVDSDGQIKWAFDNSAPDWAWHLTGYYVALDEWNHIAVVYENPTAGASDPAVISTYVNGTLVETFNGTGLIGDSHAALDTLRIGGRENNPANQYFEGQIADVRVWNTARTQAEIQTNLDAQLVGNETGLVGYYLFNEASGTTAVDGSTQGNDGVLGGGVVSQEPTRVQYSTDEDTSNSWLVAAGVLSNDIDPEGDTLTVTQLNGSGVAIGNPTAIGSGALVTLNADGSFSYNPSGAFDYLTPGQTAVDTFTYTVDDGNSGTDTATASIVITGVNDAPTLTSFAAVVETTNEDTEVEISLADLAAQGNEADVDGTVDAFIVKSVASGTLKIGTSAGAATAWAAGTNDTIDATRHAYWTPGGDTTGSQNAFAVVVEDNLATESAGNITAQVSVTAVNDTPTGSVTIDNTTPAQGDTLTASNTLADADGMGAITYTWKADGSTVGTGTTYVVTESEVGKAVTVEASYTDGHGTSETVSSAATAPVTNVNDAPTGSVTIDNTTPAQGDTLTASNTLADADGMGAITYTWKADGSTVGTGSTYTVTESEVGKAITVEASYTDGHGTSESAASSATAAVTNVNDAPILDNAGSMQLENVARDDADPSGDTVAEILLSAGGDRITDADAAAMEGIAVVGVNDTNGEWQYDAGGGWTAFGTVDDSSAVLLDLTAMVRFVADPGYVGTAGTLTFRAWDQTDGNPSGATGVNVSVNGAATPFSVATETASLSIVADTGVLWITTDGSQSNSGVPGLDSWDSGDLLQHGNPNLSLEPGTTDGTFSLAFNIDLFASGATTNAVHYVTSNITVGTTNAIDLQAGDLLLSLKSGTVLTSGSTPTAPGFTNSLTVAKEDVFVFRPDTPGDYSAGTFAMLLENPLGADVRAISLIEQDTVVGDATLNAGDFLIVGGGGALDSNIGVYETSDVGAGTTSGTYQLLLDGSDVNVGIAAQIWSVDLVEQSVTVGGRTLSVGTILLSVNSADTVGQNGLAVTQFDIFAYDVAQTTLVAGAGNGAATASLFFDGSDVNFEAGPERIDGFTLAVTNTAPVLNDTTVTLNAVSEDAGPPTGPVGTLIASLADLNSPAGGQDNVTDIDAAAVTGIAVVGADTANGAWYYSTDNGTSWNLLGSVTSGSARVLAADGSTRLYFRPNADYTGTIADAITFRAWDQSDGRVNGAAGVNTTVNGGSTSFSSATDTASLTVTNVNDAPTGSVTIDNTTPAQGDTLTASNTLADADGMGTITYTWKADGSTVGTGVTYVVTESEVGTVITVEASYTDGHGTNETVSSAATAAVTNVNDAPTGSVTIDNTTPAQGDTLTASNTLADSDGMGAITYTWKADGSTVGTGATYTVTESE
ncbi:MAG: DUF4347 domain-containing protein, partial [Fuerstiella sp.]